jgi:hypothetical protein
VRVREMRVREVRVSKVEGQERQVPHQELGWAIEDYVRARVRAIEEAKIEVSTRD